MINVEQPSATFRPGVLLAGTPSPRAGHLPFAADLIAALKPSMIVELGVSSGDTYFGFCQLVAEDDLACTCYGVDTWQQAKDFGAANNTSVHDAVTRHNAKYRSFSHLIRKSFDKALSQFSDESIDILNIEGLQPYESLKRTYEGWLPKVKPGGVILLNDISLRGGEAGSWRLWEEIRHSLPHFYFRNNNGLGVLGKCRPEAEKAPFLAALFEAKREQQESIRRYYFLCTERLEMAARLGASGASDTGCALFQVFRSEGGSYETSTDLSHILSPGSWVNLHLHLPDGLGDRPLRIDVTNRPAVVDIASVVLRKEDGHAAWTWNPKDESDTLRLEGSAARMPAPDFFRVLCTGSAPHVFLPEFRGPAFNHALDLEIRLRVDLELSAILELNHKGSGDATLTPAAVAKSKSESAKQLAQARLEYEAKIKQLTAEAEARLEAMRQEFEQQNLQLTLQLEEERRLHQATIKDRDQVVAQQPRMLQEISIAQGNVEELKAELERLSAEHAHVEYDLIELRKINATDGCRAGAGAGHTRRYAGLEFMATNEAVSGGGRIVRSAQEVLA